MGKDQFGDSDKSRRIPPQKIEKSKKPPTDTKDKGKDKK